MLSPTTGENSLFRIMYIIICVYDLNSEYPSCWDSVSNPQWRRERLQAQHSEAQILTYGYEDLNRQASAIGTIDRAARDLLSKLDGPTPSRYASDYNDLGETGGLSVLDPTLPVLFICRGLAGLIVKKACMRNVTYIRIRLTMSRH